MYPVTRPARLRPSRTARLLTRAAAATLLAFWTLPAPAANITTTWNGSSGDWFDPANWSDGIPINDPANLYRPIINAGTLTLDANLTTSGLALAAPALLTITSDHTYSILPTFTGANSIAGRVALQAGAFLDVYDNITLTNASISGDGTYRQPAGVLTLLGTNNGANYFSNFVLDGGASITAGNLIITHHADFGTFGPLSCQVVLTSDATLNFAFNATAQNLNGTYNLAGITTLNSGRLYGGFVTNSGTINLTATSSDLPVYAPSSLVNTGAIKLSSAILDLTAANSVNLGGTVTLDAASSINAKNNVTLNNASISGAGVFQQISAALNLSGASFVENFALSSGAALAGTTLTITGHADFISTNVSAQKVILAPNASLAFATPASSQALSGFYELAGVTTFSGPTNFTLANAHLSNAGTLLLSGPTSGPLTSVSLGYLDNTGSISLQNAILDLSLAGGTLTGDISLGSNSTFRTGSASLFNNANFHGQGLLNATSATFRYAGETFVQNARVAGVASAIANSTLHFTGTVNVVSGVLSGNMQLDAPGTLFFSGNCSFTSGTFHNYATVAIGTDLAGNFTASSLGLSGGFINDDTLVVESNINGSAPFTITNNGLITNYTASLSSPYTIANPVINNATISGGFVLSAGTNYGLLSPDAGPFARTLTLGNNFTLAQGSTLTSANGGVIVAQLSLNITGQVTADHFSFASLAGAGSLTLLGNNSWGNGASNGPTLLIPVDSALLVRGSAHISAGTVSIGGALYVGYWPPSGPSFSAPLAIDPTGTLINNGTLGIDSPLSGPGTLTNNGLLTAANTANSAILTVSAPILNNGTISGNFALASVTNTGLISGTATLSGILNNSGTLSGQFTISVNGTSSGCLSPDLGALPRTLTLSQPFTLANGAILTSANNGRIIAQNTLTLTGVATADHLSFTSLAGAGTLNLLGNNSFSGGIISGTILNSDTLLASAAGTITTGSLVNNDAFYLGFFPPTSTFSAPLTLNLPATFINNGTIFYEGVLQGPGTLTNNGLITTADTRSSASRTLSAPILNNGTISGSFTLSGAVTNTGLITGPITTSTIVNSGLLSGDSPYGPRTLTLGGFCTLNDGARISSTAGTVSTTNYSVILNGNSSADHFIFGALQGSGTLHLSGPNTWSNSNISGPVGTPTLLDVQSASTLTLGLSGSPLCSVDNAALLNNGFVTSSANLFVTLGIGGTFDNRGTLTFPRGGITGSGSLANSGLLIASTVNLTAYIACPLYNSGTVSLTSPGILSIYTNSGTNSGSATGLFTTAMTSSTMTLGTSGHPYILNNATLSGPGVFTGYINLAGSANVSNAAFGTITGSGMLDVSGSLSSLGMLRNAQLRVLPTGTLYTPQFTTPNIFIDNATFTHQGVSTPFWGTINLLSNAAFFNQGTLTVSSQPLSVYYTNSSSQFANSGLLNIASTLTLNGFPFTSSGTLNLSGSSVLSFAGGTLSGTIITSGNARVSCASSFYQTPNVLDAATIQGSGFGISGSLVLTHQNFAERFSLDSYTQVTGPGSLTVSQLLTLAYSNAPAVVSNGAHIVVLPSGTLTLGSLTPSGTAPVIDNSSILNQGLLTIPANYSGATLFKLANGATFTNTGNLSYSPTGGTTPSFKFDADSNTANAFINTGSLAFASGAGKITIAAPFYNTGTLSISPLQLYSSSILELSIAYGGSGSGYFLSTTSWGINFSAPYTLNNATLSGYNYNTAPLTLHGNVRASRFDISHNLLGDGSLSAGALGWTAGTLQNSGGILVNQTTTTFFYHWSGGGTVSANFIVANSPDTKALDGITLLIAPNSSAAIAQIPGYVASSATISCQNGAQILNQGSFYSYIPNPTFANPDNHSANALINTGTFGRAAEPTIPNTAVTTLAIPFHNSGLVDIQQGRIDFAGGYVDDNPITPNTADFHFAPNTALYFSGGNYDFGDSPFDLGPGGLAGTGSVHGQFTSAGTIAPGNSPGTLCLTGNLALASAASTNLDLNLADPAHPQADALLVLGNFSANGTLSLTLLAGTPDSSPFTLISATSFTGTFANAPDGSRLFDSANSGSFLVSYSPTSLTLSDFQPVPEPASLALLSFVTPLLLRRRKRARRRSAEPI